MFLNYKMDTYFVIYDMPTRNSSINRIIAICSYEDQATEAYNRLLHSGMGATYVVLERVDTNDVGFVVSRVIIAEGRV